MMCLKKILHAVKILKTEIFVLKNLNHLRAKWLNLNNSFSITVWKQIDDKQLWKYPETS